MGNHPKMTLKKSDAHSLSVEATGTEGLRSPSEMHLHAMTVSWTDNDHLRETRAQDGTVVDHVTGRRWELRGYLRGQW